MAQTKQHLRVNLIDPDRLVKVNDLKEVTNPIFFIRNSVPTPDGLLSNEIFGITKYDRENTFAYADLHEEFLNPLVYKTWCNIDKNIRPCVHGSKQFIVNDKGELEEVEEGGSNGVQFLKKNLDKFNFRRTNSNKRDDNVDFLEKSRQNKKSFFITKMIILPAFYRDVGTDKGKTSVGEINKLYQSLLISIKALKESADYGLNLAGATRGRVQETILQIYDWIGSGTVINGEAAGKIIPGKLGLLRRAVYSKTTDNASRVVITAPELKAERLEDIEVDLDYSLVPMSIALNNFLPFVIFEVRRFFENEFAGDAAFPYMKNKTVTYLHPKDYQIEFSDEKIEKEINRFITGYSNRFIPIEVPTVEGITMKLRFKGYNVTAEEYAKSDLGKLAVMERDLTWCDVLYMATCEAVKDRHVLITRYPIDSYFNQFPTKAKVSSTIKTEPMIVGSKSYKSYPMIRQEDIGRDTSNKFIDSFNLCNLYLGSIDGDYDGDQITSKGIWTDEANRELDKAMNSVSHYVDLGGKSVIMAAKESVLSLYSLTLCLPDNEKLMTSKIEFT